MKKHAAHLRILRYRNFGALGKGKQENHERRLQNCARVLTLLSTLRLKTINRYLIEESLFLMVPWVLFHLTKHSNNGKLLGQGRFPQVYGQRFASFSKTLTFAAPSPSDSFFIFSAHHWIELFAMH